MLTRNLYHKLRLLPLEIIPSTEASSAIFAALPLTISCSPISRSFSRIGYFRALFDQGQQPLEFDWNSTNYLSAGAAL
jgi:hypothetical protein